LDISQRAKLQASNIFSDNSPYGMPSDWKSITYKTKTLI
jgi:hypothetical protein